FWVLFIELLKGVTHRLDRAVHVLGHAPSHFRRAATSANQSPRPLHHISPLIVAELAKSLASAYSLAVLSDKTLDAAPQDTYSLPLAVKYKPTTHEPLFTPPRNRLCRDVEHFAQLIDGMDRLAGIFDLHIGRVRNVFNKQPQVMSHIAARQRRRDGR